jgi:hypothetical protein
MKTAVVVLAFGFGLVLFAPPVQEAYADHATLSGLLTLNTKPAPPNVQVTARSQETECGTFATGEGGAYEFVVPEECGEGTAITFALTATGDQAPTPVTVDAGEQIADIAFEGLSLESLQAIGAEEPPPEVITLPSAPLTGRDLYAVTLIAVIPAMILLLIMVLKASPGRKGPENQHDSPARPARVVRSDYRSQVEGMILVTVVLAVILLGVTDKIGSDGLVSVLAAIVGYTLGRELARRGGHGETRADETVKEE